MITPFHGWITACIPHFQCHRYVGRAVTSLLAQSYPWIRVIVVSDADNRPPWKELEGIYDRRLIRFELEKNRGPYFCLELARRATPDPFFMMQDADDWSAPVRAERLINILVQENADFVTSQQPQFRENENGVPYIIGTRWNNEALSKSSTPFAIRYEVTGDFVYRIPHAGLFRSTSLASVGGYFGGFRTGWDTFLTNVMLMTGRVKWTPEELYYRLVRPDSLTHSSRTGTQTVHARAVASCLEHLYKDCYSAHRSYLNAEISRSHFIELTRGICDRYVQQKDHDELNTLTIKLRLAMS